MSKVTATELASRIARGIKTTGGRYDWASKVEVREYVLAMVAGMKAATDNDIERLEARIAELQLSWWQRIKRRFAR